MYFHDSYFLRLDIFFILMGIMANTLSGIAQPCVVSSQILVNSWIFKVELKPVALS